MPIYATGKRKDGRNQYRVIVNYTDILGKHRTIERTAYGNAEAKELELKLTKEVAETNPSKNTTVAQLIDEYLAKKKQDIRETSYDKTRRNLEYAVLPHMGNVKLDKLNASTLQVWKNKIG